MATRKKNAFSRAVVMIAAISAAGLVLWGCGMIEGDFFGKEFGNSAGQAEEDPVQEPEDVEDPAPEELPDPEADEIIEEDRALDADTLSPAQEGRDLDEMRDYFTEAMKHYDEGAYVIAEYYLNKIKDSYLVLQDHIFYYIARSLLMQKKYEQSEEYYDKVLQNFPDSIWVEMASLESADLYFLQEDYAGAQERYFDFMNNYPESGLLPYSIYQLAVCMEKNGRAADAFSFYKRIWLEFPASEYAGDALLEIERLVEEGAIASFSPSLDDLYGRAESLFSSYLYQEAAEQLIELINVYPRNSFTGELYASTCFKLGMSYYNMGEYDDARDWLLLCYEESPASSVAHAALFFLGRAYTNLDNNTQAVSYYERVLDEYPSSIYGDDALYRMGRIYSIDNNAQKAIESFDRVFREYPSGDKTDEALWELGWIQYKSGNWSGAETSFSNMAELFSGTGLQEKALYWQAKCHEKLGEKDAALQLCRRITGLRNYSYYTFAAEKLAGSLGSSAPIPAVNTGLSPQSPGTREMLPGIFEDLDKDIANTDGWVDHITKALELIRLGFYNSAAIEIGQGEYILEEDPERALEIATLYYNAQDYFKSLQLIHTNMDNIKKDLSGDHLAYAYFLYYPYGFREVIDKYSLEYGIDPLFVLAVIRQESNFKADAGSYAGARGLMQIMPATGKNIAGQIGLSDYQDDMLYQPETSIRMGIFYLDQQLDNFDGNLAYCLGAYNGGPGAMSGWVSRFGGKSEDEFIEHVTYLETKEYIKRVLGNYYFYRMLYPDSIP